MKMTLEHYNYLKDCIGKLDIHEERLALLNSNRQPKDFDKRLRWDCLYKAVPSKYICDNLYPYLDDTHIDTALRSIFKEIQNK